MLNQMQTIKKAQDFGSIRNSLGILTDDKKGINPQNFLKITGLGPSVLSNRIKISRPQLYKKTIPLKLSDKFIKRVVDIVLVTDLAYELFNSNYEETTLWLMSPNSLLFGDSPFEVCMRGDGEPLKKWLLERLGKQPIEMK